MNYNATRIQNTGKDHAITVVSQLLQACKIAVSQTTLRELANHPDYPSLYAVSEFLDKLKIDSLIVQLRPEDLIDIPVPAIAHLHGDVFVVLTMINANKVIYHDGTQSEEMGADEFILRWSGHMLLCSPDKYSGDPNVVSWKKNRVRNLYHAAGFTGSMLMIILIGFFYGHQPWSWYATTLLKIIGVAVTTVLSVSQVSGDKSVLNQFCRPGSKIKCDAVLQSRWSKLFGVSLSEWGWLYFAGSLLFLLIGALASENTLPLVAFLSAAGIPFVIFSIFYQAAVVRQWCLFCLAAVSIICLDAAIQFTHYDEVLAVRSSSLFLLGFSIGLALAFGLLFRKILITQVLAQNRGMQLETMKRSERVFHSMLNDQPQVEPLAAFAEVLAGNALSPIRLTIVTAPTCFHCKKADALASELLEKFGDNLCIQFVFFVDANNKASRDTRIASRLLGTYLTRGSTDFIEKLSQVYQSADDVSLPEVDVKNEPMVSRTLATHLAWCKRVGVNATPSLFINYRSVPSVYYLDEVRHQLLRSLKKQGNTTVKSMNEPMEVAVR